MLSVAAFLLLFSTVLLPSAAGEIRFSEVRSDDRSHVNLNGFVFSKSGGQLELNITQLSLSGLNDTSTLSKVGFLLCPRDDKLFGRCTFESDAVQRVFTFDHLPSATASQFNLLYSQSNSSRRYFLVFANPQQLKVSMKVRSAMYNLEQSGGVRRYNYLSAGTTVLPTVFFLFALSHCLLAVVWATVLYKKRFTLYRIHFIMLAVVVLKALDLLCEAEYKSYIKRNGSPHGWDVLFYAFSLIKGITLFTLTALIGSGWSFLKPYLQVTDKYLLVAVIILQFLANILQVFIDKKLVRFAADWAVWSLVVSLVTAVCMYAVLFQLRLSMNKLEGKDDENNNAALNLNWKKKKNQFSLFQHYFIGMCCYMIFPVDFLLFLETVTPDQYLWTSNVVGELATLAFYVFTGYKFRPDAHNPHFVIDDDQEEYISPIRSTRNLGYRSPIRSTELLPL